MTPFQRNVCRDLDRLVSAMASGDGPRLDEAVDAAEDVCDALAPTRPQRFGEPVPVEMALDLAQRARDSLLAGDHEAAFEAIHAIFPPSSSAREPDPEPVAIDDHDEDETDDDQEGDE